MPFLYPTSSVCRAVVALALLSIPALAVAQATNEDRFIGIIASGNQTQFTKLATSTLDNPRTLTEVNDYGENPIRGCEVLDEGAADELYCVNLDGTFSRIAIDTGALTTIGTLVAQDGEGWEGLAYDGFTETLYGLATTCSGVTSIYTVDPSTATATLVGSDNVLTCGVAIAADNDGELFAFGVQTDLLVHIDPATGAQTSIGSLDYNSNFSQGMDIDPSDGTCYIFAFNDPGNTSSAGAELRTCDLTDATTQRVGRLGDLAPGTRFTMSTGIVVPQFVLAGEDEAIVRAFELRSIYPNPVRDVATVQVSSPRAGLVELVLYDVLGREVQQVFAGAVPADQVQTITLRTKGLAPGLYVLRATGDGVSTTRRITVTH